MPCNISCGSCLVSSRVITLISAMSMYCFRICLGGVHDVVNSGPVGCLVVGRVRPSRSNSVDLVGRCCPGVIVINGGGAFRVVRKCCNMNNRHCMINRKSFLTLKRRELHFSLVPVIR